MFTHRLALLAAVVLLATLPLSQPRQASAAVSLPPGFTDTVYASGFGGRLTAMTWGPGGRLFVSEKQGSVRIVEGGRLVAQPFLTIPTATDGEKGLKSLAFDPNYADNGFVYLYYTDPATLENKVSRFTRMAGDPGRADPASEVVLIDGIASGIYHSGGALAFGADGKLYISTGDGSYGPSAQGLGNLNGKILRINRDGTAPADNPFVGQSGKLPQIWAYGLRNPYTFAFNRNGALFINDVGEQTWEELNRGARGANFGWPTCEGACADSRFVDPVYAYRHSDGPGKSITGAAFYDGDMFPADYAGDYFFGDYVGNYIKRYDLATGNVSQFAAGAPNPVDLDVGPDGALYYLSVEARTIHRVAYGSAGSTPTPTPSADGNLLGNGGFESTSGLAPWRANVRAPAAATFTRDTSEKHAGAASLRAAISSASQDWHVQFNQPNVALRAGRLHTLSFWARAASARALRVAFHRNTSPYELYFQKTVSIGTAWQRFTIEFTPSVDDQRALLALNMGSATGNLWLDEVVLTASQTVGQPPVPQISLPAAGARFNAGDTVSFAGSASDPEDGTLPAAALTWEVVFHHDTHTHPFLEPFSGKTSGSFTVPDTGEVSANIWYRIHLTAADSDGNSAEVTRDIHPNTAMVTLATQPAGLKLTLNGIPITAPHTFTGVVGFRREIAAPASQTLNGKTYRFVSWSDGGAATHTITTPSSARTYTALYQEVAPNILTNPGFDASGSGWRDPWQFVMKSPAVAAFVRDTSVRSSEPAALRVDVLTADRLPSVQVFQAGVSLVGGSLHTLTFKAQAASARTIKLTITTKSAPYTVLFQRTFDLTTGWKEYRYTFTPGRSRAATRLVLNVGAFTGSVWLDDVALSR